MFTNIAEDMKAASIQELKQELTNTSSAKLVELCLRMARFKKENKELLTYLLFESFDETAYINLVKTEIDESFDSINTSNIYFSKKSLRKIVRTITKYIRYTGSKQVEIELLIHFCQKLANSGIPIRKNTVISNLYQSQLKKINKVLETMHEDLQYEYKRELSKLDH